MLSNPSQAHPHAAHKSLEVSAQTDPDTPDLEIAEDVLGMFFWTRGAQLVIWNWHTGHKLAVCFFPPSPGLSPVAHEQSRLLLL